MFFFLSRRTRTHSIFLFPLCSVVLISRVLVSHVCLCCGVVACVSYLCEEGELGEAMIIPARYIGEAEAPIFYFYDDGIRFKKE